MQRPVPRARPRPAAEERLERPRPAAKILHVGVPDLVVGYRPDKPGPSTELGQPDRRVRHRSPGDEARRRHDA